MAYGGKMKNPGRTTKTNRGLGKGKRSAMTSSRTNYTVGVKLGGKTKKDGTVKSARKMRSMSSMSY